MESVLLIVHLVAAAALVVLVLLQQGKGADMGAAFGAGASATVFGSQGSASFLTRGTATLAAVFFLTSLSLAYFSGQNVVRKSVTELPAIEQPREAPAPTDIPAAPGSAEGGDAPAVPRDVPRPE
ncbi:preprotein translocase subunit SecG [Thiohalomonas denitrificans]|uniref:Protein-export membrane protein SecG n=1 Tax=Thiohalomonas denitrificans TaxID=415747 RepID=A0A1G5PJV1_9GAMM|nr:preprotein translocase subunit SecG [Thiohalomonas denitrificans]SCZ49471.1 preprotein translocase subunit SecG [Thiohalomonas denitrificans]